MKKFISVVVLNLLIFSYALAADQNDPAAQAARDDYRAYLEQLKIINQQYKAVTNQMRDVIREEGIPVWNETTGEIELQKGLVANDTNPDIQETPTQMIVKVDLPGVNKKDVEVKIEDNQFLKVNAVRDSSKIVRLIRLPHTPGDESPKATLQQGVLTVTIAKAPQVQKQVVIPIQ